MEDINAKKPSFATAASAPVSREAIESELSRLEGEFKKGQALIQTTQADVLRIEGAILTLRQILATREASTNHNNRKT